MRIRLVSPAGGLAALLTVAALTTFALAVPGAPARAQSSGSGGYVGVLLQDLNDDLRESYDFKGSGVLISEVTDGSPADKAGLRRGDIVSSYRGGAVASSRDLTERVRNDKAGDRVSMTVWREGKPMTVTLTLGSRDDMPAPRAYDRDDNDNDNDNDNDGNHTHTHTYHYSFPNMNLRGLEALGSGPRLGVQTQDLDSDLGSYFNRPTGKGVLVLHVEEDTPAKKAGIHAGDVIIELDGKTIDDTDDLRSTLADKDAGPVRVTFLRKGTRQTLTATLEDRQGSMSAMPRAWIMSRDGRNAAPRGMSNSEREDLKRQMDDLRRQMDDLKNEMEKMSKDNDKD